MFSCLLFIVFCFLSVLTALLTAEFNFLSALLVSIALLAAMFDISFFYLY